MHILITSGGTKVPIDPVRFLANWSRGHFGRAIATASLRSGHEVSYLAAVDSESPFCEKINFYQNSERLQKLDELNELAGFYQECRHRYHEYSFQTFSEYANDLARLVQNGHFDVIILAAAVSDYLVTNYSIDKIRSHSGLSLHLTQAPKVINQIKQWAPQTFLVGFKLLVDAADTQLLSEAMTAMSQHHANLMIANNLTSIQRGAHEILLIEPDGTYTKHAEDLGNAVIRKILEMLKGAR